jgi:hypothetical protein
MPRRTAAVLLAFTFASPIANAIRPPAPGNPMDTVAHLQDYRVVELRRYRTAPGELARFVRCFDTWFPEAFEQLGAMVFGQFTERGHADCFTWLRGFRDMDARAVVNASFYYGPVWKEHRVEVNAILPDSDNVLLLQPLHATTAVPTLPAMDPFGEPAGTKGVVVAQLFPVRKGEEAAFAAKAEAAFARYRMDGVHAAGILVSLDAPNNFPQLPVRTDGPWLVWLGIVRDEDTVQSRLLPAMAEAERTLAEGSLLRGAAERVLMDPTPRSRLRWLEATAP